VCCSISLWLAILSQSCHLLKEISTSLKHKRHEFDVADLIGSLYVEKGQDQKALVKKELSIVVPRWRRRKTIMHMIIRRETKEQLEA
jgi:hypothetical protein